MKTRYLALAAVAAAGIAAVGVAGSTGASSRPKLEADKMLGVPATMTGTQAAANMRGVPGGGLPWSIGAAEVELKAGGKVELAFDDLVFAAGPNNGRNTVATMRVLVSCIDGTGAVVNNLSTPFPVTTFNATTGDVGGDAMVETTVALPDQCFAPLVFVTSPGGAWFAVAGL